MNNLQNARVNLLKKRDALLARRTHHLAEAQELLEDRPPDVPDVAAERTAAHVLEQLGEDELWQLKRITIALDRIEDGSYGRCVVCGEHIPAERMRVTPEADRCVECSNSH